MHCCGLYNYSQHPLLEERVEGDKAIEGDKDVRDGVKQTFIVIPFQLAIVTINDKNFLFLHADETLEKPSCT